MPSMFDFRFDMTADSAGLDFICRLRRAGADAAPAGRQAFVAADISYRHTSPGFSAIPLRASMMLLLRFPRHIDTLMPRRPQRSLPARRLLPPWAAFVRLRLPLATHT